jgi:hypothetical protein
MAGGREGPVSPPRNEAADGLDRLETLLRPNDAAADAPRRPLPVERWNPPFCGRIDIRIAADGVWFHEGRPIRRKPLVALFASILRRDPDRFVLVTPVEMLEIEVEDAPFTAVGMRVVEGGEGRTIHVSTDLGDEAPCDDAHPLRFDVRADGSVVPYAMIRRGLEARFTRSLALDLLALGEVRRVAGEDLFGVESCGRFFVVGPAP